MGRLLNEPARASGGGEGRKFLRLYLGVFDDDDRALFQAVCDEHGISEAHRRIRRDYPDHPIGRSVVERGVAILRGVEWDASKIAR